MMLFKCHHKPLALMCVIALIYTTPAMATSYSKLMGFIRHYEAGGSYDRYYVGIQKAPPKPITQMTVADVMAWQTSLGKTRSTAAGAYQIIRPTLRTLVAKHNINTGRKFDKRMQDHLAKLLIANCDYKNTPSDNIRFANCLAGIWAALPLVSGPNKGRSKYHGIAGNRALTNPQNVMALLNGGSFTLNRVRQKSSTQTVALARGIQITRVEKIKANMRAAQKGNTLGKSIVYSTDPFALD